MEEPLQTEVPQNETLDTEVKRFAENLPYWSKHLAEKILLGSLITANDIDSSYKYLLEELKLTVETDKPEIAINYNSDNANHYKTELILSKLENVQGVNALSEGQVIEFSPNLTIVFGINGSGKSGYIRLLKDVFYSKAKEPILPNINLETGHKPINAKFIFKSGDTDISYEYIDKEYAEFEQFAVFDGKSVLRHMEGRNEFEFRPAGLSFFSDYTNAIALVEQRNSTEISGKKCENEFSLWFDGSSEIKILVENLSASTKIEDLIKYTPFSEKDELEKSSVQKEYDELLLSSKGKEKELKNFETIRNLLKDKKNLLDKLNIYFSTDTIERINNGITDYINKSTIAKKEGIENFKTDKIEGVGSEEWRNFILAAEDFAKKQKPEGESYPINDNHCLLCLQPLTTEAELLIASYWKFLKSLAEENSKLALENIEKIKQAYETLNFDLFPEDNILTIWLSEKYPLVVKELEKTLTELKSLSLTICGNLQQKTKINNTDIKCDTEPFVTIDLGIIATLKSLEEDEQNKELAKLLLAKNFLEHKEKFNLHLPKFQSYVQDQIWIKKAGKANYAKRQITDTEKSLSNKYFNQKYVNSFNEECEKLNGNFGIEISHTGSAGKSYRQLKLKGKNPNAVLSEGEQKVIAIADFLAEMQLSHFNKGIIFDDPVTSLDNERKKQIAERLAHHSVVKQVIIFTHDLVFFYHIKNFSKKYLNGIDNSFIHHSLEKVSPLCGKVIAHSSPASEGQYNHPTKAEEWLRKSKLSHGNEKTDFTKAGLSALRSCYEALAIFTILGGTVQRFDPQIRIGRLKDIKYEKTLIDMVIDKHGEISDLIEGHLPSDEFGIIPTPEILEQQIVDFKDLKDRIKKI